MKTSCGKEMRPTTGRLGTVLRERRENAHRSLEEVAGRAGLTPVALHNLETGKASSKSDNYERVAEALGALYPVIAVEAYLMAIHEELETLREQLAKKQRRDL